MKKSILLLAIAMLTWASVTAQTPKSYDVGYVFVSPLNSHSKQLLKSRVMSTIDAGRVAVKSRESDEVTFTLIDAAEYFVLGNGHFYKYYPPAQDYVPAEYVSAAEFKKATREVRIYSEIPGGIEIGKVYEFKVQNKSEPDRATIRAIRLAGADVRLVTEVDYENGFRPSKTVDMSGETVLEVAFPEYRTYMYKGQQIMLASNLAGQDYSTLAIDENGVIYAEDDKGNRRLASELSFVFGEYPTIGYAGWISDTELVINDVLYVRVLYIR